MKEEKEVLEHFAGVFTMMNPLTFKEIFQTTVPYMVERISKNYALQVFCLFVFPPIGNNQPVENSLFLKVRKAEDELLNNNAEISMLDLIWNSVYKCFVKMDFQKFLKWCNTNMSTSHKQGGYEWTFIHERYWTSWNSCFVWKVVVLMSCSAILQNTVPIVYI